MFIISKHKTMCSILGIKQCAKSLGIKKISTILGIKQCP